MSICKKLMTCHDLPGVQVPSSLTWIVILILIPCMVYGQKPDSAWQVFTFGSPSLSLTLPDIPQPMETAIPSSMIDVMKAYYAYTYEDYSKGFGVMMVEISYIKKYHPKLSAVSDQAIHDLEALGAENIMYTTSKLDIDGIKGLRQKGTLRSKGSGMDFTSTILSDGSDVWKIIIYARTGDAEAGQLANSILTSITFTK